MFYVVEVEIDCSREIFVVSVAYVMEDLINVCFGLLVVVCVSV